jgi:hypothetical protein
MSVAGKFETFVGANVMFKEKPIKIDGIIAELGGLVQECLPHAVEIRSD